MQTVLKSSSCSARNSAKMLRLQPSELGLTQNEVQQWGARFHARNAARSAIGRFQPQVVYHSSAKLRAGPERSRDDAVVHVNVRSLPQPSFGFTESDEDPIASGTYSLDPPGSCFGPSLYHDDSGDTSQDAEDEHSSNSNTGFARSVEGSSPEDLIDMLSSINLELPRPPVNARDHSVNQNFRDPLPRRYRPRSFSDPSGSIDTPIIVARRRPRVTYDNPANTPISSPMSDYQTRHLRPSSMDTKAGHRNQNGDTVDFRTFTHADRRAETLSCESSSTAIESVIRGDPSPLDNLSRHFTPSRTEPAPEQRQASMPWLDGSGLSVRFVPHNRSFTEQLPWNPMQSNRLTPALASGRHAPAEFAIAHGGRPRVPMARRTPTPAFRTPHRNSEENNDDDMVRFEEERRVWLARNHNAGGVLDHTPPREGQLEWALNGSRFDQQR